jgi:hypothetical protein
MRAARALGAVGLAVAAVDVTAQPCLACSCIASTPREYAKRADVAFTGRVTRIAVARGDDGLLGDEWVRVRFRVGRKYKGRIRPRVLLHTGTTGNTCRFIFRKGKRYTVFATRHHHRDRLTTNICSGTKRGRINPDRYGFDRHRAPPAASGDLS